MSRADGSSASTFLRKGMRVVDKVPLWVLVLVFLAAFSLRAVGLESDLPSLGVGMTSLLDQGTYSKQAINFFEYGSWTQAGEYEVAQQDAHKSIVLGSLLQIATMFLFGDNYIGFRLPYLIFALLSLLLAFLVVKRVLLIVGASTTAVKCSILGLGIVLVFDFPFHVASLAVDSSIVRLFANLLFLYIALNLDHALRCNSFLLGFVAVANVFFVYFSSVTTGGVLVFLLFWLLWKKQFRKARTFFLFGFLGTLAAVFLAEAYYLLAWGQEAFYTAYSGLFSFSERLDPSQSSDTSALFHYFKNGLVMWTSNPFFFSPFLLGLSLVSLFCNIVYAFKEKSTVHFLLVSFVLLFFAQAILASDWNIRKTICVYPILLVGCVLFLYQLSTYWRERFVCTRPAVLVFGTIIFAALFILLVLAAYGVRADFMQLAPTPGSFLADFQKGELRIAVISSIIQSALFIVVLFGVLFRVLRERADEKYFARPPQHAERKMKRKGFSVTAFMLCAGISVAVLVNAAFSWKYFYGKPTFTEKEAMVQIGELIDDEYAAGPFPYSYSLYNDIKPLSFSDEKDREYFQSGVAPFTLDYANGLFVADLYVDNEDDLVLVDSFNRDQKQWGERKNIGVYELDDCTHDRSESDS